MTQSISRLAIAASALVMLLVMVCGGTGLWATLQSSAEIGQLDRSNALVQRHMEADMMHDAIRGDIASALAARDPAVGVSTSEIQAQLKEDIAHFKREVVGARALAHSPAIRSALNGLQAPLAAYEAAAYDMLARIRANPQTAGSGFRNFQNKFDVLEEAMSRASDAIEKSSKEDSQRAIDLGFTQRLVIAGFALACLMILFVIAYAVRSHLVRPLIGLSNTAEKLARDDFAAGIGGTQRGDELGAMARSLVTLRRAGLEKQQLEQAVKKTVRSLQTGTREIAQASEELARRTELQASSIDQTVVVMDNLANSVRETASGAGTVSKSVAEAQVDADEGGRVVNEAVSAMGRIEKSSQEIAQIISVIDSIAFQTNLLALNAGVEAARAGDAGKGFAVVANEVRALAQRSADAAKEIKELITASSLQVESGVKLVAHSGNVLNRMVERIREAAALVHEIAATADEQATGLQQINNTIGDMSKTTQQNAAMVEQATSSVRLLAQQASDLGKLVLGTQSAEQSEGGSRDAVVAGKMPRTSHQAVAPRIHGNLALASQPDPEDWAEF